MSEHRSKADGNSLTKQQGVRPHRPGRTITCYYCGIVLHEKHLQAHMKQCHLVLEGCPNKCGMTVERHAMEKHLTNECMNIRRSTSITQLATPPPPEASLQHWDVTTIIHRENMQNGQKVGTHEEWNEKVLSALKAIKKALVKEENERCRAEAEWKLEIKKLNQRMKVSEDNMLNSLVPQVTLIQFHELKAEVQVLKENLIEERQKRQQAEQQIVYEIDKSILLSQQIDDLNLKFQDHTERIEAWKISHADDINRMLDEIVQERQHRLRAETELKMEAARLEDLCCTLEQWRDKDKGERCKLEDKHRKSETDWMGQFEQQKIEIAEFKKMVTEGCKKIDDFNEFLTSENLVISGLWTEQLNEIRNIRGNIDSLTKVIEAKSKELAQVKQQVKECDEIIMKPSHSNYTVNFGHVVWRISDFEEKMADAKKNDTVLHSPVFYSSQYGYKLRVEVRLNGLGQWTGRHMTASLQVLEGEWDPLLQWPFSQKVTLILRDQTKPPNKVKNLVKNLVEGRSKEDPAGLHVFIPHSMLKQHNYVVNNIMFLEATVG